MSGVEIAGFVLAAFPVTVQLIQGYQEGCKHLVDWRRFQVTYLRLKQGLNRQYTIFDNNVRILLLPLVETEEELEDLLNDPGGLGWKNRDLEDALQRRLSHSYTRWDVFVFTQCDCRSINTANAVPLAAISRRSRPYETSLTSSKASLV